MKHQLNTDILDENGTYISNALSVSSRKCSIEYCFGIVKYHFKHNLKKLLNSLEFFFVQFQGYEDYCKVVKGYENFLNYFKLCCRGTKAF